MRGCLVPFALLFLQATSAQAAFLIVDGSLEGYFPDADGGSEFLAVNGYQTTETTVDGPRNTAGADLSQGGTTLSGSGSGDITTGTFSGAAAKSGASTEYGFAQGAGSYQFETVRVSGNGSVAVSMDLTGSWDVAFRPAADGGDLYTSGDISMSGTSGDYFDTYIDVQSVDFQTEPRGTIDRILSFVAPVSDGDEFTFDAGVLTQLVYGGITGTSSIAGLLSILPSAGVGLEFGDPQFLSNAPAPVPLPPGAVLLASAVAVAWGARRRRSARTDRTPVPA